MRALIFLLLLVSLLLLAAAYRAPEPMPASPLPQAHDSAKTKSGGATGHAGAPGPAAAAEAPPPASILASRTASAATTERGPARDVHAATPGMPSAAAAVAGIRRLAPGSAAHAELVASAASGGYAESAAPVVRLYLATFGRIPDDEGFDHYLGERDRGTALAAIADEFARSRELDLRYGALDDAAFVDRIFQNVYGLLPDAAQRAYWMAQLQAGAARGDILVAFSEGAPFRAATDNETFVAMAYVQATSRLPGAAEHARWVAFLDAGHSRAAMVEALLAGRRGR